MKCEFWHGCTFFAKYRDELGPAYKGFISLYCDGDRMEECMRRQYHLGHGESPPAEMLPSGVRYRPQF